MVQTNVRSFTDTCTHGHILIPRGPQVPSCLEIALHQDKVENFPFLAETKGLTSLQILMLLRNVRKAVMDANLFQ